MTLNKLTDHVIYMYKYARMYKKRKEKTRKCDKNPL